MAWPDALPRRGLYLITPDTTDNFTSTTIAIFTGVRMSWLA